MKAFRGCGVLLLSFSFAILSAQAFVDKTAKAKQDLLVEPRKATQRIEQLSIEEPTILGLAARELVGRKGGDWTFRVDRKTGKADLVQGSGIPIEGDRTLEALEPRVREFIAEQQALIAPREGELVLDTHKSAIREKGRLITLVYRWRIGGVPVEGASVFVRLNSGNVTQFGAPLVGEIDIDTVPAFGADEAAKQLLAYAGDADPAERVTGPELLIQPEDGESGELRHRLVWRFVWRVAGRIETWEGRIDAHSGEVVGFCDVNEYARAVGGVYPRSVSEGNETRVPLPYLAVSVNAAAANANSAGSFAFSGGTVSSGLNGIFFDTNCSGCSNPAQPSILTQLGTGRIDFGVGGQDQVGNGSSTPADRNTFYHLNQVRRVALKWLPDVPWISTTGFDSNVNADFTCNAVFNGSSVTFFRSGGGCNNTGEISDVIQHEWGHGIDAATAGGDMGEGTADVTAMHMSHSPIVGPGFRTNGNPVRNLDRYTNGFGVATLANYVSKCGTGPHCYGQVYGQTAWELAQALRAKHGPHTGWRTSERLFFISLPDAGGTNTATSHPIYDAYINADDDDGNLTNGTPNAQEIHAAFSAHGIAGNPLPSSPGCSRPPQPALTVNPQCDRFQLSWSPVAGIDHYEVFRSELRQDTAYFSLGELPASQLSYTDLEVAPGIDYWYVVMAVQASGCESTVENPQAARLFAQPVLSVTAWAADDVPRGNRSGFPDPGEEVDLTLTLSNFGDAPATAVTGTLTSTAPGVTILAGASGWPAIAQSGAVQNPTTLRFKTTSGVACGALLRFNLVPSEGTGCASEASYFDVRIGQPNGQGGYVCDSTPACYVKPTFNGLQAASPGASCGETQLSWQAASSNCTNATLSYGVYRGTQPSFVPDASNRVAAGLTGTSFVDTLLAPGATYHYVVRATDSRSGEDLNTIKRSATAPVSPDVRAPAFGGIAAAGAGHACGETLLSWSPGLESCSLPVSYQIYRSTNPGFTPGPGTLVGASVSTSFEDAALQPGVDYTYVVRARDSSGNEGSTTARLTVRSGITDRTVLETDFEPSAAGWQVVSPNDATAGNWERADPQGTSAQPGDDHSTSGVNCWVTGPVAGPSPGTYDVDGGTTTLLSASYDLSQTVTPAARYWRWFSNDRGNAPGEDPFLVEVSNDNGATWSTLEQVVSPYPADRLPLAWVPVEIPLNGILPRTSQMRFRFTATDAEPPSFVEAAIDDFSLVDLDQGCTVCGGNPPAVTTILAQKSGDDVVLDWTADPVQATRFVLYQLSGAGLAQALRIGSTTGRTFVHAGAALAPGDFYYKVTAVNACGAESP